MAPFQLTLGAAIASESWRASERTPIDPRRIPPPAPVERRASEFTSLNVKADASFHALPARVRALCAHGPTGRLRVALHGTTPPLNRVDARGLEHGRQPHLALRPAQSARGRAGGARSAENWQVQGSQAPEGEALGTPRWQRGVVGETASNAQIPRIYQEGVAEPALFGEAYDRARSHPALSSPSSPGATPARLRGAPDSA